MPKHGKYGTYYKDGYGYDKKSDHHIKEAQYRELNDGSKENGRYIKLPSKPVNWRDLDEGEKGRPSGLSRLKKSGVRHENVNGGHRYKEGGTHYTHGGYHEHDEDEDEKKKKPMRYRNGGAAKHHEAKYEALRRLNQSASQDEFKAKEGAIAIIIGKRNDKKKK